MAQLLVTAYVEVSTDPQRRIVKLARTEQAFPSLEAMAAAFEEVIALFDRLGRHRWSLLIDTRRIRGRNDAAFEAAFAPYRQKAQAGFRRVAVLVRSRAGALQVQRYGSADARVISVPIQTFVDEAAAHAYLSGT